MGVWEGLLAGHWEPGFYFVFVLLPTRLAEFATSSIRGGLQGHACHFCFDGAKIRHQNCGSRMIAEKFSCVMDFFLAVVIWSFWSFVKMGNGCCQNLHYKINIKYLYYSEQ